MQEREDFLEILKMRFVNLAPKASLKFFAVPTPNLKEYRTGKNGFLNEPDPKYRMHDMEIKGT